MKRLEVIARARTQIAVGTIYALGHGGYNPDSIWAFDSEKKCDCTGALSWFFGVSRRTNNPWYKSQNGGWLETSAIVRDVGSPFGIFRGLLSPELARIADALVYGDSGGRQGHVGLISAVSDTGQPLKVIHCSKGNYTGPGRDAIQETGPEVFIRHGAIVARCAFVED